MRVASPSATSIAMPTQKRGEEEGGGRRRK